MGGLPVLQAFYQALGRASNVEARSNDQSLGLYWLALGQDRKVREIKPSARVSFFKAFGITPDH